MNRDVVMYAGDRYEIQYVVHSNREKPEDDVFACYRLDPTDGMPVGSLVWIARRQCTN